MEHLLYKRCTGELCAVKRLVQSLLCGPTLDVSCVAPLLEQLSDGDAAGLSVHVLHVTRLGQHGSAIEKLLDRCPQAIVPYAHHELRDDRRVSL